MKLCSFSSERSFYLKWKDLYKRTAVIDLNQESYIVALFKNYFTSLFDINQENNHKYLSSIYKGEVLVVIQMV